MEKPNMFATKYVVKPETGEIIDSMYEGDRILRKASIDNLSQ